MDSRNEGKSKNGFINDDDYMRDYKNGKHSVVLFIPWDSKVSDAVMSCYFGVCHKFSRLRLMASNGMMVVSH